MDYADKTPLTSIIMMITHAVISPINILIKLTFGFNRLFLNLAIFGIIIVRSPKIRDIMKTNFQNI